MPWFCSLPYTLQKPSLLGKNNRGQYCVCLHGSLREKSSVGQKGRQCSHSRYQLPASQAFSRFSLISVQECGREGAGLAWSKHYTQAWFPGTERGLWGANGFLIARVGRRSLALGRSLSGYGRGRLSSCLINTWKTFHGHLGESWTLHFSVEDHKAAQLWWMILFEKTFLINGTAIKDV